LIEANEFRELFGTDLVTKTRKAELGTTKSMGTSDFLAPERELQIPDSLSDTIAFAYVPTPPEYFAESFVPPNASVYHLRLSDVVRAVNASRCHRRDWTGSNIRVVMADSGFSRHSFFDHHNFSIQRTNTPSTSHPEIDATGHGTGESANTLMIAPGCQFFGVKHDDYSAEALETALSLSPHISVSSWGWDIDYKSPAQLQIDDSNLFNEVRDIEQIIADAVDDGVTMIFASGNGHKAFPGCMPEVFSIGGTTVEQSGNLKASNYASSFSSSFYPGRNVPDFCGVVGEANPGSPLKGHIMLPVPNGCELEGSNLPLSSKNKGWGIFSGTSAAAPQIAGVAALMLSINPSLKPNDLRQIIEDTAVDVSRGLSAMGDAAHSGHDLATGSGFVNAFEACLRAEQLI
jgi:subtilisin family serine protease